MYVPHKSFRNGYLTGTLASKFMVLVIEYDHEDTAGNSIFIKNFINISSYDLLDVLFL